MSSGRTLRWGCSGLAALALVIAMAAPAFAQADPNTGNVRFTGGLDFANAYMFRGFLQDDTEMILWPYADLGFVRSRDAGLSSVGLHVGVWNSLHTGATGTRGPTGKLWYEGDFYTTLALGFDGGFGVSTTYTAYTSPNNSFSSVKELAVKLAFDEGDPFFGATVGPYALVAFELDTSPGFGQADGGSNAGTYLEIGAAPGFETDYVSLAFPLKGGFSLRDYYELAGVDNRFGFFSVGATGTVPLSGTTRFGTWSLRGGGEFLILGDTTKAFNRGDGTKVVAFVGFGMTY